jgi:hypothetical protein
MRWYVGINVIKPFLRLLPSVRLVPAARRGTLHDHQLLVGRHRQQCDS